ncbi:uncharacterized protein LOC131148873 [Malania oleifera]|uniref:uncharacterized protein LOC131148873 n=1 Tax=Malania oleifera TaxID=397392 RepID=UPI0025AE7A23|nr:uncharacterized protein LOC131148873 [Malania oleifera]XP_057954805.1 uncharacterized protein LOC131148873 [Malania oleifera]XP_057954806.1 uncharacterized protein LOC131148873 [Malania oleifera]XP_057954807.1 uncharacterized protein LOC131148873 [Malania oleifera]
MVRFSCFNAHVHSHKPKRSFQPPAEAMQKTLEDCPQNQVLKDLTNPASLNKSTQKESHLSNTSTLVACSSSVERRWKSEEINSKHDIESDVEVHQTCNLKKSISLGSELDREGRVSCSNITENEMDQGYFCDDALEHNGLVVPVGSKDPGTSLLNQSQEVLPSESPQVSSDMVNNESIFSIGDAQNLEKEGYKNTDPLLSHECNGDSSEHMSCTRPVIIKSSSMPNIGTHAPTSGDCSPFKYSGPYCRSFEDLNVLEMRHREDVFHEVGSQGIQDRGREIVSCKIDKNNFEIPIEDGVESYNYVGSARDWIVPVMEEVNMMKSFKGGLLENQWDGLPSREFKIKRIEEWVMDLQHCSPLEETNESIHDNDQVKRVSSAVNSFTAAKLDSKDTPGMEAAKQYISSLSAAATTAQLANNGLVVVPFLSAFVSLRVLNLSGNAIVRITAGVLPRGLHMLNLSKNNISTIEGLRELNRLRVLDLSYNRIFRIGHGLASCSSLKELYLAGNKISEVEGLHRLLKLNVLDLRFNKISTAKCLGQLAANYNSLQAISLEGNPAQKNVGDEQLKKQLQSLLPHLVYYNRQPIKVGTFKDNADRSTRLGINAHDRSLRSEHKPTRKGTHGSAPYKVSSLSTHGRKSQAVDSPKQTKRRHGRLPPSGTGATMHHQHHLFDFGSKLLSMRPDFSIHRSRSEGTLGAL